MFKDHADAFAAVKADYEKRPATAARCQLGELIIMKPDWAQPEPGQLWVMGFNGGETTGERDGAGDTASARRWFRLCTEAAEAVGAEACIIGERTHWGSPTVSELVARVGSPQRFRELLRLHARANRTLLREYRPSAVWLTGLSSYMAEAFEDYQLSPVEGQVGLRDKRGRLWQQYVDDSGLSWLATIHPTGARMSNAEFARVKGKLREIAH